MTAIADTLQGAEVRVSMLAGIACGAGPGGFTSLRIAAALAKGIAHAARIPLLAAPSLAWVASVRAADAGVWLVTLDALRGESYAAAVRVGAPLPDGGTGARRVESYTYLGVHPTDTVAELATAHRATILTIDGDVAAPPIAAGAAALAPAEVDLSSWEPAYGRLAEAQARWEATNGPLPSAMLTTAA